MNKKNENFATVIAEMTKKWDISTQDELAARLGISVDTIDRYTHKGYNVTERSITKLHLATGKIYNIQWLRGESDIKYANISANSAKTAEVDTPTSTEHTVTVAATIAAKDETIAVLRAQLGDKDQLIESLRQQLTDTQFQIADLRKQLADLQARLEKSDNVSFIHPTGVADDHDQKEK